MSSSGDLGLRYYERVWPKPCIDLCLLFIIRFAKVWNGNSVYSILIYFLNNIFALHCLHSAEKKLASIFFHAKDSIGQNHGQNQPETKIWHKNNNGIHMDRKK